MTNLDFIIGAVFGFGTFMLTYYIITHIQNVTTKSFNRILDKKFDERFKDEE